MKIVLVGCSGSKLNQKSPARELYTGTLFLKARAYAETHGDRWFVLSALHTLVDPLEELEPYDLTLGDQRKSFRDYWGVRCVRKLEELGLWKKHHEHENEYTILAGKLYAEPLVKAGLFHATTPLKGLGIGQQLAFLTPADGKR